MEITSYSRALLENLTVPQLVNKRPILYGTHRFITVFTKVRHLSLSWARPIQYTTHTISSRTFLILSSHLCLGIPSTLFLSDFSTNTPHPPLPFLQVSGFVPVCVSRSRFLYVTFLFVSHLWPVLSFQATSLTPSWYMHSGARSISKLPLWTSQVTSITGQQWSIKKKTPQPAGTSFNLIFSLYSNLLQLQLLRRNSPNHLQAGGGEGKLYLQKKRRME